jgi:hypothetical protein
LYDLDILTHDILEVVIMRVMDYEEFQRQIGKAGLTIREFADLVKMNRISISNYGQKGEVPSHLAVIAALLGEMAERKINYRDVLSRIEILPKKPRGAGIGKFGGNKQTGFDLLGREEKNG